MADPEKPQASPTTAEGNSRTASPPADPAVALHQAIQAQIAEVLTNGGLSEDEKQQILVALQCPCCGAGGLSLSIKLGAGRTTPNF